MAIQVVCDQCKNRIMIPDSLREKGLDCPVCGQPMAVPGATGRKRPPPLGAASLLNVAESELVASRSPSSAANPLAAWHRRRTPPTALWAILAGLSLLLIVILIAVMLKSGRDSNVPRERPSPSVAAEKQ